MQSILTRITLFSLSLSLFISAPSYSATERRTALVIGNSNYETGSLRNPANDAEGMAATLKRLGFDVILKKNATQQGMEDAIRDLGDRLKKGGVGLFFYAGHGVQIAGKNYLLPIGVRIDKETDVKYRAVDADMVLDEMGNAGNNMNIVILDACRDNPFGRSFRTASRGLAIISSAPRGTLISYSTSPGNVAADGSGRNSPYTASLMKHMTMPGLQIEEVFKNVRQDLVRTTQGKQIPWELSSLEGHFYFTPASLTAGESTAPSQEVTRVETARLPQARQGGEDGPIAPAAGVGDLYIASDPPGARLYLDEREMGSTPLELNNIGAGKHMIELKKGEILFARLEVDLKANDFVKRTVKLDRARGRVRISSEPDGAMIFFDHVSTGKLTPDIIDTVAGEHEIGLLKQRENARLLIYQGKLLVEPNRRVDLSIKITHYDRNELAAAVEKAKADREQIVKDVQLRGSVFGPLNLSAKGYTRGELKNALLEKAIVNIEGQYCALLKGAQKAFAETQAALEAALKKAEGECLSRARSNPPELRKVFEQCMGGDRDNPAPGSPWSAYGEGTAKGTNKLRQDNIQIYGGNLNEFKRKLMTSEARQIAAIDALWDNELEKSLIDAKKNLSGQTGVDPSLQETEVNAYWDSHWTSSGASYEANIGRLREVVYRAKAEDIRNIVRNKVSANFVDWRNQGKRQ